MSLSLPFEAAQWGIWGDLYVVSQEINLFSAFPSHRMHRSSMYILKTQAMEEEKLMGMKVSVHIPSQIKCLLCAESYVLPVCVLEGVLQHMAPCDNVFFNGGVNRFDPPTLQPPGRRVKDRQADTWQTGHTHTNTQECRQS